MPSNGDDFRKRRAGDPLPHTAAYYNALSAMFLENERKKLSNGGTPTFDATVVLVKNTSGTNVDRFGVLGISAPLITPTNSSDAFKNQVAFEGTTPATASHLNKFLITLEPIANGKVGRAVGAGIVPVQLDVQTSDDTNADVDDGVYDKLKTGQSGGAKILWKESGTGTKWALVRLGAGDNLPTPRPLYSVLMAINEDEDVAFDGPRFQ